MVATVFHNRWWLDVVSGGRTEEVEVRSGSRVVARLPYVMDRGLAGHRLCNMPELTHCLGPVIDVGDGTLANRTLKHYRLMQELIAKLPSFAGFHQTMHRGIPETLAFAAAGYGTQAAFTYEIRPKPVSVVWSEIRDKTRNVIRRAKENYEVVEWDDPAAFAAFYDANLRRRGLVNGYRSIEAACEVAMRHGQGCILAAKDARGGVRGAIFVLWDQESMYYLLSSRSSEADNTVISLLVWDAICRAMEAGRTFDFDGIGPLGNRVFYTGFGGEIAPRYVVTKHSFSYLAISKVTRMFERS